MSVRRGEQHGKRAFFPCGNWALRPIHTEDVPGVARPNPLFVLLRRVVLRSCTARAPLVHGNSWQLLSVDWP